MADFVTDFVADCVTDFGIFLSFKSVGKSFGGTQALGAHVMRSSMVPNRFQFLNLYLKNTDHQEKIGEVCDNESVVIC